MGRAISNISKKQHARFANESSDESQQEMVIDEELFNAQTNRTVIVAGEINEQLSTIVIQKIVMMAQFSTKPIRMIINTPGGAIDESLAIYDAMKLSRAPIRTAGLGKVMSAGVLLLAAGEKGHRLIGRSARVMIHNGYAGICGDAFELEHELNEFKRLDKLESECLIAETKLTRKQIDDILKSRLDHYIAAKEAIKYGIADKLTG